MFNEGRCYESASYQPQTRADAIKYYSQSYRLASFDNELCQDYANYLTSIGKEKQAKKIFK